MKRIHLVTLSLLIFSLPSNAQTTEFTYQGHLAISGVATSAPHDFEFRLFTAASNGTQLGVTMSRPNVLVSNGVFVVQLDFGAQFDGSDRWLQIGVRPVGGPTFTTLLPRQRITSAPHNIKSLTASAADSLSIACTLCVTDAHIQSIAANKVNGTVASATTAANVSGIVPIANGGTGSSIKNFIDLSSNQSAIEGNKSFLNKLTAGGLTVDASTLHVDSMNDRIGIGTTAPLDKVHIVSGTSEIRMGAPNNDGIEMLSSDVGHSPALTITNYGTNGRRYRLSSFRASDAMSQGSFVITDLSSGFDRITIDSAGKLTVGHEGNGVIRFNGGFFSAPAGISTEDGNRVINMGVNTGREAPFSPGNPGYWLRADIRPEFEGIHFFRKAPTTGTEINLMTVNGSGNVGIGTESPSARLSVVSTTTNAFDNTAIFEAVGIGPWDSHIHYGPTGDWYIRSASAAGKVLIQDSGGTVGIGTSNPDATLSVNGTASKPGGGSWAVFSDERLKRVTGRYTRGLAEVLRLEPIRFEYRSDNTLGLRGEGEYIGFSAQEVARVVPEAVSQSSGGFLQINNDPILWTMLNAVKEQQVQIDLQAETIRKQQQQINALTRLVCTSLPTAEICEEVRP